MKKILIIIYVFNFLTNKPSIHNEQRFDLLKRAGLTTLTSASMLLLLYVNKHKHQFTNIQISTLKKIGIALPTIFFGTDTLYRSLSPVQLETIFKITHPLQLEKLFFFSDPTEHAAKKIKKYQDFQALKNQDFIVNIMPFIKDEQSIIKNITPDMLNKIIIKKPSTLNQMNDLTLYKNITAPTVNNIKEKFSASEILKIIMKIEKNQKTLNDRLNFLYSINQSNELINNLQRNNAYQDYAKDILDNFFSDYVKDKTTNMIQLISKFQVRRLINLLKENHRVHELTNIFAMMPDDSTTTKKDILLEINEWQSYTTNNIDLIKKIKDSLNKVDNKEETIINILNKFTIETNVDDQYLTLFNSIEFFFLDTDQKSIQNAKKNMLKTLLTQKNSNFRRIAKICLSNLTIAQEIIQEKSEENFTINQETLRLLFSEFQTIWESENQNITIAFLIKKIFEARESDLDQNNKFIKILFTKNFENIISEYTNNPNYKNIIIKRLLKKDITINQENIENLKDLEKTTFYNIQEIHRIKIKNDETYNRIKKSKQYEQDLIKKFQEEKYKKIKESKNAEDNNAEDNNAEDNVEIAEITKQIKDYILQDFNYNEENTIDVPKKAQGFQEKHYQTLALNYVLKLNNFNNADDKIKTIQKNYQDEKARLYSFPWTPVNKKLNKEIKKISELVKVIEELYSTNLNTQEKLLTEAINDIKTQEEENINNLLENFTEERMIWILTNNNINEEIADKIMTKLINNNKEHAQQIFENIQKANEKKTSNIYKILSDDNKKALVKN